MAKPSPRAARVVAAGKLLYGDTRWQSPLARLTGLSPALLQKIGDGTRAITDDVDRKVAKALITEAGRMRLTADKVNEIAGRILQSMED
ncbi:hypothetical protein [Tardiphaga sp. 813_E8_N1_3]|uniref:hypothetical protein n=1 Tax=Tardiphaga sp. 813_E8_N1_3 TaxID=3240760 RepID=UPI003F27BB51